MALDVSTVENEEITLKVDGAEEAVPLKEVIRRAQVNSAADARLAAASKAKSEAEAFMASVQKEAGLGKDILLAKAGDDKAWERIGTALGFTADQVKEALGHSGGRENPPKKENASGEKGTAPAVPPEVAAFFKPFLDAGIPPAEVSKELFSMLMGKAKNSIDEQLAQAVGADSDLAAYNTSSEEKRKAVLELAKDALRLRMVDKGPGAAYGPEVLSEALSTLKSKLKSLGIRPDPSKAEVEMQRLQATLGAFGSGEAGTGHGQPSPNGKEKPPRSLLGDDEAFLRRLAELHSAP